MTRTHSFFKKVILTALMAAVIIVTMPMTTLAASTPATNVTVTTKLNYTYASEVLTLVNQERKKQNLKPLSMDKTLFTNAITRAAECSVYYSHTRANGSKWNTAVAKTYKNAAENIAYGYDTPKDVVKAWMGSAGHKKNIMNSKYTCIGIGYVEVNGEQFWTQEFTDGTPAKITCKGTKTVNTTVSVANSNLALKTKTQNISLTKGKTTNAVMELRNIECKSFYPSVVKAGLKYTTSNKNVASVDSNGVIRGTGKGTAKITVTLAGNTNMKKTYTVTVK